MEMNKKRKDKLRKEIEEQVKNIPDGERLHLDKELLENLLFIKAKCELGETFENTDHYKEKVEMKYLVWSGEFLSKIDLSEVSFDDVVWDACFSKDSYADFYYYNISYDEYEDEIYNYEYECEIDGYDDLEIDKIIMKNTNAKIDFSKSFPTKYIDMTFINNCDFSGTDLSSNLISTSIVEIYGCNFSNTGIDLTFDFEESYEVNGHEFYSLIRNNEFSNNDFSKRTITAERFDDYWYYNNNFSNTGLRITTNDEVSESLKDSIKNSYVDGCYIDGKLYFNEQNKAIREKNEKARLYSESKDKLRKEIEEQVKNVPDGERIHLDKNLLEDLMFLKQYGLMNEYWQDASDYPKGENFCFMPPSRQLEGHEMLVKYLIWNGSFLSKIDLSEVSFDDAIWDVYFNPGVYFIGMSNDNNIYHRYKIESINMSNTNANIRFYNAFQMKYVKNRVKTFNDARLSDRMKVKTEPIEEAEVSISNADFSNTNLKGNKFLTIELENCDFSNTGIKITNYTSYEKTNFSNNDFSYYEIDADYIDNLDSNFSNTGAKIIVDHYKTFERNIKKCYAQGGNIDGCYIDGVLYEYDKIELSSKKKR